MENKVVRMRASPAVGVGGMFATGQGLDAVVATAPMTPPYVDMQNWRLETVEGQKDKVRVVFHDNANHIPWVWGYVGTRPSTSEPIVLASSPERQITWYLALCNNGVENAYTLLADIGITGAGWWAGTNQENQVVFVPLPLGVPDTEKPYWVLTPMN